MSAHLRWGLALMLLSGAGCSSERVLTGYSVSTRGASSPGATITKEEATVPLDGLLLFGAWAEVQTQGPDFEHSSLNFSTDGDVASIRDTIEVDTWLIVPSQVGSGTLRVYFEGREIDTIPLEVN